MTEYNMTPFKNLMVNCFIGANIACVSKLKYHLARVNMISNASRDDAVAMEVLHDMGLDVDDLQHETKQLSYWKWAFQVMLDETGEVMNYKKEMVQLGIERAFNYCAKENKKAELLGRRKPYSEAVIFENRRTYAELQGVKAEPGIPKGFYDWIVDISSESNKRLKGLEYQTSEIKEQIDTNDEAIAACLG
tara:strand:+ start:725 stop:1297 length:573 start_codon:yes stop_codon:yes gene_type:complete